MLTNNGKLPHLTLKNGFVNKLAELLLGCLQQGLYFWADGTEQQRVTIVANSALHTIYSNKKIQHTITVLIFVFSSVLHKKDLTYQ